MSNRISLTQETLGSGAWQFATLVTQGIVQLAVTAVLARLLGPAEFGVVAVANIAIGFAGIFSKFGFGQAIVQQKILTDRYIRVAFSLSICVAVLLTTLIILIAPIFALFFHNPEITGVLRALSLCVLFNNFSIVAEFLLVREIAFRKLFWVSFFTYTLGYAVCGIIMAMCGYGVWALVGAAIGTSLVHAVVLILLKPHPKRLLFAAAEFRKLTGYGGGVTLSTLFKFIANNGDNFIVGRCLGSASLGIYQQAFNIMVIFARYLGDVLERVLFAVASRIQEQTDRLSLAYCHSLSIIHLLLVPISVMMIVLAPELVMVYLGPKWRDAVQPAQLLMIGLTFRCQSRISDAFVNALGVVYRPALRKVVFALAVIIGAWFGKNWGIAGVALAITISMVIDCFLTLELGLRLTSTKLSTYAKGVIPGFILGLVAYLACFSISNYLRHIYLSSFLVLFCSIAVTTIFLVIFAICFKKLLGTSGIWLFKQLFNLLQSKLASTMAKKV
ncbi:MAG: lipopolysaccharide biosynthesis protein [Pedobacter sp.]